MSAASYALIMLIAGIGVPVMAALNAALGRAIGAPAVASVVLFGIALVVAAVVAAVTNPGALARVAGVPRHLLLAGLLIALYVLSITWVAPHFGVGNAVFYVLLGQLVSTAAIDHFGLFGAIQTPLSFTRALGIGVMGIGVFLTQIAAKA